MQKGLHAQAKADEGTFEKMDCWCTTNEKEKTESVAAAESDIKEAEATIEGKAALSSKLETEIEQLRAEVKKEQEAIATATKLREKENREFEQENTDQLATIDSLSQAIKVLGKHHGEGEAEEALAAVTTKLRTSDRQKLNSLVQQPTGAKSYNSRSGEIYGMLKSMRDTFEADVKEAVEQEARSQKNFEELRQAKTNQIDAAKTRTVSAITELTDSNIALVQAKHDLKDANKRRLVDSKFLVDLQEQCTKQGSDYEERVKSRQEEIEGVGEALKILTDDSARDLFGATLGFIQVSEVQTRKQLVKLLQKAAKTATGKNRAAEFALLATSARLDGFVAVKKKIDEMLVALKKEQEDERTHRDWCNDEMRKNDVEKKDLDWQEEDLTKKNNQLAATIETLDEEIQKLNSDISEAKVQVKRASEDREAANQVFKQTVADARGTEAILNKVLERLQKVYAPDALQEKKRQQDLEAQQAAQTAMLQSGSMSSAAKLTADAAFLQDNDAPVAETYEKQSAGGVLGMIQMAINDAQRSAQEAIQGEQDQQNDYQDLVKDTAAQLGADNQSVNDKSEAKANAEVEKQGAETDLEATVRQLEKIAAYRVDAHAACDFVVDNFSIRQEARAAEMESIEQAKAILSGA